MCSLAIYECFLIHREKALKATASCSSHEVIQLADIAYSATSRARTFFRVQHRENTVEVQPPTRDLGEIRNQYLQRFEEIL